jgi:glucose dehydrogenase
VTVAVLSSCFAVSAVGQSDWPMFGHDDASTRYSPLSQIDTSNVQNLARAWTYHMKKDGPASQVAGAVSKGGGRRNSQATPIVINGVLYMPTPYGTIVALDPETGTELWTFKVPKGRPAGRAVTYWPGDATTPASLLFGTNQGYLMSISAATGLPTAGFGEDGAIDLKPGVANGLKHFQYDETSPPSIYKNLVITGAQVQEAPAAGPAGDVRAWDVHTGKLAWQFHSVPRPGEVGNDTWADTSWKNRSGTNVWGMMSVDTKRGLVVLLRSIFMEATGRERTCSEIRLSPCMPTPESSPGTSRLFITTSPITILNRLQS